MLLILVKTNFSDYERCIIHQEIVAGEDYLRGLKENCNDDGQCVEFGNLLNADFGELGLSKPNNNCHCSLVGKSVCQLFKICMCAVELLTGSYDQNRWKPLKLDMDSYIFSCLMYTARLSEKFRQNVIRNLVSKTRKLPIACNYSREQNIKHLQIEASLIWPTRLKIDRAWNERVAVMLEEKRKLESTLAWLSTLGGAYSALGDNFAHCAEIAGKISIQQLQLAFQLGDQLTQSRCKIYFAISLVQQGYIKQAKRLVRQQYKFATSVTDVAQDQKLINMCQGIWARLRYIYSQKKRCDDKLVFKNDLQKTEQRKTGHFNV